MHSTILTAKSLWVVHDEAENQREPCAGSQDVHLNSLPHPSPLMASRSFHPGHLRHLSIPIGKALPQSPSEFHTRTLQCPLAPAIKASQQENWETCAPMSQGQRHRQEMSFHTVLCWSDVAKDGVYFHVPHSKIHAPHHMWRQMPFQTPPNLWGIPTRKSGCLHEKFLGNWLPGPKRMQQTQTLEFTRLLSLHTRSQTCFRVTSSTRF